MIAGRFHHVFCGLGLPLAATVLAAMIPATAATAQSRPLESQVKAAFISKFAAYVAWPPSAMRAADDPIQLCIIGRDPFSSELDQAVAGQRVDQRVFVVRRLDSTANAATCHIAFLGGSAKQSVAVMLGDLRGKPVLTVTDSRSAAERGMVTFVLQNGRVRFHIDDALAAHSNLSISARLLSLAISVKPRARA